MQFAIQPTRPSSRDDLCSPDRAGCAIADYPGGGTNSHFYIGCFPNSTSFRNPGANAVKEFRLVPLLVGRMSGEDYAKAADALLPLIDDETLLQTLSLPNS